MMRKEHNLPTAYPLLTGEDSGRPEGYGAYRPRGTLDWLAIYTIAGHGFFAWKDGHHDKRAELTKGALLLVRPGAPQDYGADQTKREWHNLWAHFVPYSDMLAWMDWPTVTPGVAILQLPTDLQSDVLAQLREMHRVRQRGIGRSLDLGLNCLQRALLLADAANPRGGQSRQDARVRKAVDYLLANLTDPPSLVALANVAGLSRSRFARLFEEQVGEPPGQFTEHHRLLQVKRLLEHTRHTLQEIAEETGFSSPFYLSLRFKRRFGVSPREYRRMYVDRNE